MAKVSSKSKSKSKIVVNVPVKVTEPVDPTVNLPNHWTKFPKLRKLDLPGLIKSYDAYRVQEKAATTLKDEARGALMTTLQLAELEAGVKVACLGFEVGYTETAGRVSVADFASALIRAGVDSGIVEAAKAEATGAPSTMLNVRPIKLKE